MSTASGLMAIATRAFPSSPYVSRVDIYRQFDTVIQLPSLQGLFKRQIVSSGRYSECDPTSSSALVISRDGNADSSVSVKLLATAVEVSESVTRPVGFSFLGVTGRGGTNCASVLAAFALDVVFWIPSSTKSSSCIACAAQSVPKKKNHCESSTPGPVPSHEA